MSALQLVHLKDSRMRSSRMSICMPPVPRFRVSGISWLDRSYPIVEQWDWTDEIAWFRAWFQAALTSSATQKVDAWRKKPGEISTSSQVIWHWHDGPYVLIWDACQFVLHQESQHRNAKRQEHINQISQGKDKSKRPPSWHVMSFFEVSISELEANILSPTPRLGTVVSFAPQIQGNLSFQVR